MKHFGSAAAISALLVTIGLILPVARAEQSTGQSGPDEGILLLRNGNLLRGRITRTGDGFDVLVDGGQVHVRAADVEAHCRTLEEGYQRKRALIQWGDLRDHLELAQWCQRCGLLQLAAEELAQARALDPTHPMISLIERRIAMSLCQPQPSTRPAEHGDPAPSLEELDRLVREMPPGSMEKFTQTVQPLLVNHCSAGDCHGPGSESDFRLLRSAPGRPPSRRLTQRNLHSTLAWIDRDNPAASRLLAAPIRPHGSAKAAVFTDQQLGQYQQIVDWVRHVAQKNQPGNPVTRNREQDMPPHVTPPWLATQTVQPVPDESASRDALTRSPTSSVPNASALAPNAPLLDSRVRPAAATFGLGGNLGISGPMVGPNVALPGLAPADPFDPKMFNRRFFPEEGLQVDSAGDGWEHFVREQQKGGAVGTSGPTPGNDPAVPPPSPPPASLK